MSKPLIGRIARRISSVFGADGILRSPKESGRPEEYDAAFESLLRRLPAIEAEVERNRQFADRRFLELANSPTGRQETVIENSPPSSLVALAHRMMKQSYEDRFSDVERSLSLAKLAHRMAGAASKTKYLSLQSHADLLGEALLHLGNALRINARTVEAERALEEAEHVLRNGTRDRDLKARLMSFKGSLFWRQRRLRKAAEAFDRVVQLRRALGDVGDLGIALIDRGSVACHAGDLEWGVELLREGVLKAGDNRIRLLAVTNLAEALARDDRGLEAWKATCTAETIASILKTEDFATWIGWCKGLSYLALDRAGDAAIELEKVLSSLVRQNRASPVATLSIDLCHAFAVLGRHDEMKPLISNAFDIFSSERIDQRALEVIVLLRSAVESRRLTVDFAKKVAKFVARSRYDRNLRFEHPAL